MFGYACRETPALMRRRSSTATRFWNCWPRFVNPARKRTLGPDAKSQVTLRYANGKPVEATQIVLSTQHLDENQTSSDIRKIVEPYIRETLPKEWITDKTHLAHPIPPALS